MLNSFEGINEFVAVAELQGFSAAAAYLGCSTSHVSRQINRLEERLGCALVARTTRRVQLTDIGNDYYLYCKELVDGLQAANEQVNSDTIALKGQLRVSVAGTFAEMYLVPALIEFARQHHELSLDIDFNSRKVDFVAEGFDFAIRYGKLEDSSLVARKLVIRKMMAVASPEYLENNKEPLVPEQLKEHSCLVSNNSYWTFSNGGSSQTIKVAGAFRCNNANAIVNACERGLGIAYLPKSNFNLAIADGRLVQVLTDYCLSESVSWIVFNNRKYLPLRARKAIDHLVDHFSNWEE